MAKSDAPVVKDKGPIVARCKACRPHEHQDSTLGNGMRVCNYSKKKDKHLCTVCGKDVN